MSRRGLTRALTAVLGGLAVTELAGVLVDGGREKPALWHEELAERKYFQMRTRAIFGSTELVTVGCSQSTFAFDAPLLASMAGLRNGYNAAIYRAMPGLIETWLPRVVLPLLRPKVVLYGMSFLHVNDNGILHEATRELYEASPGFKRLGATGRWHEIARSTFTSRLPLVLQSGARKEAAQSVLRSVERLRDGTFSFPQKERLLGPSGRALMVEDYSYKTTARQRYVITDETAINFEIRGGHLDRIRRTIEAARATGATIVIVLVPTTDDLIPELPHGEADKQAGERAIHQVAAENDVPVIDVIDDFRDPRWFADFVHLNGVGRRAFSQAVGQELVKVLEDNTVVGRATSTAAATTPLRSA